MIPLGCTKSTATRRGIRHSTARLQLTKPVLLHTRGTAVPKNRVFLVRGFVGGKKWDSGCRKPFHHVVRTLSCRCTLATKRARDGVVALNIFFLLDELQALARDRFF